MTTPSLLQAALSKTVAIKVGSIFAPAMLLSFVGGMLLWRALHPSDEQAVKTQLAELSSNNAELKQKLQQLAETLAAQSAAFNAATTPNPAVTKTAPTQAKSTSASKRALLKQVVEENLQLRETAPV